MTTTIGSVREVIFGKVKVGLGEIGRGGGVEVVEFLRCGNDVGSGVI